VQNTCSFVKFTIYILSFWIFFCKHVLGTNLFGADPIHNSNLATMGGEGVSASVIGVNR
jgi:hypothetical protein